MDREALVALGLPLVELTNGHSPKSPHSEAEVDLEKELSPSSWSLFTEMCRRLPVREPDCEVSVVSFNLLLKSFETKDYYPTVSKEHRSWRRRRAMTKQLLLGLDADIVAVQEAEIVGFEEDFSFLAEGGYGVVEPKGEKSGKSPKSEEGLAKCAIFFKHSSFVLEWKEHRSRAVLAALRHRRSQQLLFVVSCHLEGAPWQAAKRLSQTKSALERLQLEMRRRRLKVEDCAVVFAGDFNGPPASASCEFLRHGELPEGFQDPWAPEESMAAASHDFRFDDLYEDSKKKRPPTFCSPETTSGPCCIDYVFYTPGLLSPVAVRLPFTEEQLKAAAAVGIPSEWHPSDHVPLGGVLRFSGTNGHSKVALRDEI